MSIILIYLTKTWILSTKLGRIKSYHFKIIGLEVGLKCFCRIQTRRIKSLARLVISLLAKFHLNQKFYLVRLKNEREEIQINLKIYAGRNVELCNENDDDLL